MWEKRNSNTLLCVCMLSHVWLLPTLWTVACQTPLSTGFSRQEYWSGLSFLLQRIFLTQGSNPHFFRLLHWQLDFFFLPLSHLGNPQHTVGGNVNWYVENSMEVPKKTKNKATIWSSNYTPGYISGKNGNNNLKRTCTPGFIAALFVIAKI